MAGVSSVPSVPLFLLARLSAFAVSVLVVSWALGFQTSFLPHSTSSSQNHFIYSVLHPLLMVIGFIIISGEAILIHRWFPGSKNLKKTVHLGMQGVALASGGFGIWTKFHGDRGVSGNFYSLHSWMGLSCFLLFAAQWVIGFLSFWHRGEVPSVRAIVLPWHVFLGLYTYGLAVATAETGLLGKLTLLQMRRNLPKRGSESMVVNGLGLSLAFLCGIVILASVCPRRSKTLPNKSEYTNAKCCTS